MINDYCITVTQFKAFKRFILFVQCSRCTLSILLGTPLDTWITMIRTRQFFVENKTDNTDKIV